MTKPVRLTIKGAGEAGANAPSVDDLLGQIGDFVEILKGVERSLGEKGASPIVWRVTDAERENPISFELTPTPVYPGTIIESQARDIERIAREGLIAIQNGDIRPPHFNDHTLLKVRQLYARVRNGLAEMVISIPEAVDAPIIINRQVADDIETAFEFPSGSTTAPYREIGSVEGFVSKAEIDRHGRPILRFRARTNKDEVKAIATGEAFRQLEEIRLSDVWHGLRVRVYGMISYKRLGVIQDILATGIEVLDRRQLPGIKDIVDPDFTNGLSAEEFLAGQRCE